MNTPSQDPVDAPPRRGLYVHVPFCIRACPYCDFDFDVAVSPPGASYRSALLEEVETRQLEGPFDTLYLGGGTPSALGSDAAGVLLDLQRVLGPVGAAETTIEANPEHITVDWVRQIHDAGATRVSLGVQTLEVDGVRLLGRRHTTDQARLAIRLAVLQGLSVSADLIVGWPGQTDAALARDVTALMALGVDHVSVYALTVEPGTPWESMVRRGRRPSPDSDRQVQLLERAEGLLEEAGFAHYEVASYALPGRHAVHNSLYWSGCSYVGLGPSAASATYDACGGVHRRVNERSWAAWRLAPGQRFEEETLEPDDAAREGLWLALRQLDGMQRGVFLSRFAGVSAAWLEARILELGDLVEVEGDVVRPRAKQWLFHDRIGREIL